MPTSDNIHVAKFKARAKSLLKSVRAKEPKALREIEPYFDNPNVFKLTQAQLVVARKLHRNSWKELVSKDDWVACSFCKKWQYELKKLIAGPDVYVCNECVELCNVIIRDQLKKEDAPP